MPAPAGDEPPGATPPVVVLVERQVKWHYAWSVLRYRRHGLVMVTDVRLPASDVERDGP